MQSWDVIVWSDNKIDFVPSIWSNQDGSKYKYPLTSSEVKLRKMIYECEDLNENFRWCSAKLKKRDIKDLKKAKELCLTGQYTSNVEDASVDDVNIEIVNVEKNRKRTKPKRYLIEDDDDDVNEPNKKRAPIRSRQDESFESSEEETTIIRKEFNISTECPISNAPDEAVTSNVSSSLSLHYESLRFEIREIKTKLTRIENLLLCRQSSTMLLSAQSDSLTDLLPAETEEQFLHLNELINDEETHAALVQILSLLGGDTPHKMIFFIMDKIMGKQLALEYSGKGKKKKKSFFSTKVHSAVLRATRQRHPNATDVDMEKSIGLFLASAKARLPKNI